MTRPTLRHEYYDVSWYDGYVVKSRKQHQKLRRITEYLIERLPIMDEIILLTHVCNILNKNNFAFTRSELKTCFKKWYNPEFHAVEQKKYLFSMCINSWQDVRNSMLHSSQNKHKTKQNPIVSNPNLQEPYQTTTQAKDDENAKET